MRARVLARRRDRALHRVARWRDARAVVGRRRVRPTAHVQTVTHRLRRTDRAPRDRSRSIAIDARDEVRASFANLDSRFANANRDRSRGARPSTNIPHMADERFWPLFEGLAGAGDGALDGALDDTLVRATTDPTTRATGDGARRDAMDPRRDRGRGDERRRRRRRRRRRAIENGRRTTDARDANRDRRIGWTTSSCAARRAGGSRTRTRSARTRRRTTTTRGTGRGRTTAGGGEEASEGERGRAGVDVGAGEAREGERGTREGGKRGAGGERSRRRAPAMDAGVAQRVHQRRESAGGVGAGDAERDHADHGHERDDYSTHQVALAKV